MRPLRRIVSRLPGRCAKAPAAAAGLLLAALPTAANPAPERIVSLDYCADASLLALAQPEQVRALSPDARKPFSYVHERAADFPVHGGSTEEILTLEPDLVLRSGLGDSRRAAMLRRFSIEVLELGHAMSLADARDALRKLGKALGKEDRADAMLAEMADRRGRLESRAETLNRRAPVPVAVYVTPSGVTTGDGTYIDRVFDIAGIENRLASDGVQGWSQLTLEGLVQHPPDMVVTSFFGTRPGWQMDWRFSRHPVTEGLLEAAMQINVPAHQWGCAGFFLLDAAESLIEGRERWLRAEQRLAEAGER